MFLKVKRFYPPVVEIIPLLILLYTVFLLSFSYGRISNGVPVNFTLTGVPTAWGDRTVLLAFGAVAVGVYFLLSIINYKFILSPANLIIINKHKSSEEGNLSKNQFETIRVIAARTILLIKSLVGLLLLYIYRGVVGISLGNQFELGLGIWLIVGAIIFTVIIMTSKIYFIKERG